MQVLKLICHVAIHPHWQGQARRLYFHEGKLAKRPESSKASLDQKETEKENESRKKKRQKRKKTGKRNPALFEPVSSASRRDLPALTDLVAGGNAFVLSTILIAKTFKYNCDYMLIIVWII